MSDQLEHLRDALGQAKPANLTPTQLHYLSALCLEDHVEIQSDPHLTTSEKERICTGILQIKEIIRKAIEG